MIKEEKNRLNEFIENPTSSLWKLAVPMMFGMLIQSIYMLTDTAFIGRWVGADALAALGYVFPYMFIIMGITFGLAAGSTAIIAKLIGKKEKENAEIAAGQTILIGVTVSIIIILITLIFRENIFSIQNAKGPSVLYAIDYFKILSTGSIFMILSMLTRAILSGEGDNIFPMKVLGAGTVINILLDPIFIYYYGIKGAAWATVLSQFIVCCIFLYYITVKKSTYLQIYFKHLKFNRSITNEILSIGIPSSLSMMIMAMGAFIFNIILNNPTAVAAYQTCGRIEHLFFLPIISISSALVTLVGMFYGAERHDLIKKIIKYGIKAAITFACFCSLFFFLSSEYIIPLFTDSIEIINISKVYFSIVCFSYPFVTIGMTSSRIMQGLGHGSPVLIVTLIRVVVINAPLGFIFTRVYNLPLEFIWYSIVFSSFIASTISLLWMIKITSNKYSASKIVT